MQLLKHDTHFNLQLKVTRDGLTVLGTTGRASGYWKNFILSYI